MLFIICFLLFVTQLLFDHDRPKWPACLQKSLSWVLCGVTLQNIYDASLSFRNGDCCVYSFISNNHRFIFDHTKILQSTFDSVLVECRNIVSAVCSKFWSFAEFYHGDVASLYLPHLIVLVYVGTLFLKINIVMARIFHQVCH